MQESHQQERAFCKLDLRPGAYFESGSSGNQAPSTESGAEVQGSQHRNVSCYLENHRGADRFLAGWKPVPDRGDSIPLPGTLDRSHCPDCPAELPLHQPIQTEGPTTASMDATAPWRHSSAFETVSANRQRCSTRGIWLSLQASSCARRPIMQLAVVHSDGHRFTRSTTTLTLTRMAKSSAAHLSNVNRRKRSGNQLTRSGLDQAPHS